MAKTTGINVGAEQVTTLEGSVRAWISEYSVGGAGLRPFELTGDLDGANRVFLLDSAPTLLLLFRNGILQRPGETNDYVLTENEITTATAPGSLDWLFALGN